MNKTALFVIFVLITAISAAQESKPNPGSLFNAGARNAFVDSVARRVGDVLMVVIDESSTANFAATTEASKNDSNSISTQFFNSFLDHLIRPMNTNGQSKVAGDGKTTQTGKMNATMSVVVKQVMPNGNLVIEGTRSLITNKQTQTFVLSGIVRQEDVLANNTVSSDKIAAAEIKMDGSGMISQRQRKGILTQVLDWLF